MNPAPLLAFHNNSRLLYFRPNCLLTWSYLQVLHSCLEVSYEDQ